MQARRPALILGSVVLAGTTLTVPSASAAARPYVTMNPLTVQVLRQGFPVTGRLVHAGGRGKVVRVQLLVRGRWGVVATGRPAANGTYRIPLIARATGRYRIRAQAVFRTRVLDVSSVRIVRVVRP